MSLDEATVARIARLARIDVAQADLAPLADELSHILGWIEQLGEADTTDARPMTSVVAMQAQWREDVVSDGDKADAILANAPEHQDGYFVVPKVVE